MDLEDNGHCIRINFLKTKNDQYHNRRTTCLVENDSLVNPVKIVRAFFKLCNFKFWKANGDASMLSCVIRRTKTGWFADKKRTVHGVQGGRRPDRHLRQILQDIGGDTNAGFGSSPGWHGSVDHSNASTLQAQFVRLQRENSKPSSCIVVHCAASNTLL